jgi:hypothetical protein
MARSRDLKIQIVGDADKLNKELRKSDDALDKFGKQTRLTASISSKGFSAIRAGATGAAAGLAGLAVAGKSVVDAAIESEKSQAKLAAQLKASGISYRAHAAEIDKVIQKTSQLAGLDDEDLQDAFTAVVRSTGSVNTSLKDMALVADLARAKNMDVAKAGELVAKVHTGNVGALKRMGIEFVKTTANVDQLRATTKKATPEQLAAAKAADVQANATRALGLLQGKVKGQAEAYGKTTAGSIDRAKVSFENLEEEIGGALAPTVEKAATKVADFVNEMQDGTGQGGRFVKKLKQIWEETKPIVLWIGRATKNIANFASEHPQVAKLAAEVVGVAAAVRTLRSVSGKVGFTDLLKGGRVVMRKLIAMFAAQGAVAGAAAGTSAAGAEGLASSKVNALIRATGGKSGRIFGRAFGLGAVAGAAFMAKDLTDQVYKGVGAKKGTATGFGQALFNTIMGKAEGGIIPGIGRGDTVPAMLEPGEFVMRRSVVEKFGPTFFAGLNGGMGDRQGNRQVPGFTSGGIVSRANRMDSMDLPYLWGGGHGGGINRGVDCSGAVSYALGVSPRVSGAFMSFGKPGPGSPNDTKIYANPEHVFAVFNGRGWGTSHEHPGGGPGWLSYNSRPGFTIRHLEDSGPGRGGTGQPQESATKEALQARIDTNLDRIDALRGKITALPSGKKGAAQRKALTAQIRAISTANRHLRGDMRNAPDAQDRQAAQERSGSRLVNRIIAPFAKGIGAASRGAADLGSSIEDQGTLFGQAERLFGQTEEDLGTAAGRTHRIGELAALAKMKKKPLADQRKRAQLLKRAISTTQAELKKLRAARDKQKGPKRAKMSERIAPIVSRLDDLRAELHSLTGEIIDTQLDIGDLAKEAADVAATEDTKPEDQPTAGERTDDLISLIDARERAGVIDAATASAQRQQVRQAVLGGALGPLTERERLQIMGDLVEATQSQAAAVAENTQAIKDLQAAVDQQNAIAGSIIGVELATAQRVIGDMISNQLGTRVTARAQMPGSGALSRL